MSSRDIFIKDLLKTPEPALSNTADYKYPWVATVPADYSLEGVPADAVFADRYSDYPMKAFVCGLELGEEKRGEIEALLATDDGKQGGAADPERFVHPPIEELPFAKLFLYITLCLLDYG